MKKMTVDPLVEATIEYVKSELAQAEGGHDWFHTERVWKVAQNIASKTSVDPLVVSLGALLHDIADAKFYDGDETIGPQKARAFLEAQNAAAEVIDHVVKIIENISFKGGNRPQQFTSPELEVVQDADRLDALGAVGIARAFSYGGFKKRAIHDPEIEPNLGMTAAAYKKNTAPTINHFYEKLLLLKDRMNTIRGKELAEERHRFMEQYLEQFYKEWDGEL